MSNAPCVVTVLKFVIELRRQTGILPLQERMERRSVPRGIDDRRMGFGSMRVVISLAMMLSLVMLPVAVANMGRLDAQQKSVTCKSKSNAYNECFADGMSEPVLIRQLSSAQCVQETSWGYNRQTKYIWVSAGCSAEFADGGPGGSAGCHGAGCLVDAPDGDTPAPPPRDLSEDGIDRCSAAAVSKARSMGHNPRIDRIIDKYPDRDGYHVEGTVKLSRSDGDFSMHFLCVWDGNTANAMLGSGL